MFSPVKRPQTVRVVSSCSDPFGPRRPGEAAAPAWIQREPDGLPRPPAPPRGLQAGQNEPGDPAAGGRRAPGPPQQLRADASGPGCSGGARGGGGHPAEERWVGVSRQDLNENK